jgi:hypothetical protein
MLDYSIPTNGDPLSLDQSFPKLRMITTHNKPGDGGILRAILLPILGVPEVKVVTDRETGQP